MRILDVLFVQILFCRSVFLVKLVVYCTNTPVILSSGGIGVNSREKRKVFKNAFKDRLFENGFVYKNNEFVRIHPSNVILILSMALTPSGNSYIHFESTPMCSCFEIKHPETRSRMDGFCLIYGSDNEAMVNDSYWGIERFDKQYHAFWDKIFDDFNLIHDIETEFTFVRGLTYKSNLYVYNQIVREYRVPESIYSCIYLKKWNEALYFISILIQCIDESIAGFTRKFAELESMRDQISDKWYRSCHDMYVYSLSRDEKEKAHWEDLKNKIEDGEYGTLQKLVNENCIAWDRYCRERWPMFYK